uniref:DB domain-containing protein n=1 Tax=Rhabditophanes sp. KR3021 TaxID=114890 RepID=A0AC35U439_9BILA
MFANKTAIALIVVASTLAISLTNACLASGVCGGGSGCGVPPPQPSCGGGCSSGYSCGTYGCFSTKKARVASSLTLKIDDDEENSVKKALTPNDRFMECCKTRNLPDSCLAKCSYNAYTRNALQNMYFRTDSCPIAAAADIHYCAAEGKDHRDCCYRQGITTTLAGNKCLTFCDQRPGNVTQLDYTYMPCYDRFENMKQCFWQEANKAVIHQYKNDAADDKSLE